MVSTIPSGNPSAPKMPVWDGRPDRSLSSEKNSSSTRLSGAEIQQNEAAKDGKGGVDASKRASAA